MRAYPRLMIAAAHKSSGKTVVSTGLAAALAQGGRVATFKKGPDYIDPMWLSAASGGPCYNLDFNAMARDEIAGFFQSSAGAAGLSLIEANKGLFDGMNTDGSDSNAELAKLLGLPVVLVIDTAGMTRGIAPLLLGYQAFDRGVNIAGVILNKVGGARHEAKLRSAVAEYTDIPVVGAVQRDAALEIGERHLGLTTPAESDHKDEMIAAFARIVGQSVDLAALRGIAEAAPEMAALPAPQPMARVGQGLKIGVARDTAFGFYYPDDLEAMTAAGAELVFIDMIHDSALPPVDGLFIGGGFPETRMQALSANGPMRAAVKQALAGGLPCYAECGGLMYLCRSLSWHGETVPMVGVIAADAVMHDRPQGRGYVAFTPLPGHPWGGAAQRQHAHEFHYASVEGLPAETQFARAMHRGHGIDGAHDGIVAGNTLAGFCHLRSTGPDPWVPRFLQFVARCKSDRETQNPAA